MPSKQNKKVAVVGGGFAGLAAAQRAEEYVEEIKLYDKGSYEGERRGAWGELVWNYQKIPLEDEVPGYANQVEKGKFITENDEIIWKNPNAVILNRGEMEKYWAKNLEKTRVIENTEVDRDKFLELTTEFDLIIDATGSYPISKYFTKLKYDRIVTTLSGRIEGDFSGKYPEPRAFAYKNYFMWVVPQSKKEATVGLGCETENNPNELYEDMKEMLSEQGIQCPDREELYQSTHVSNSLKDLNSCSYNLNGAEIMLVGDSIGLSNGLHGFGLVSAVQSSEMAVEAYFEDGDYYGKLKNKYYWRDKSVPIVRIIQDKIGLKGLSDRTSGKISYQEAFEPESLMDLAKTIRKII